MRTISFGLTPYSFFPRKNEYGFAVRDYYESNGIYIFGEAIDENTEVIGKDDSIFAFFSSLSRKMSIKFKVALGDEVGGFLSGILLGRDQDITDSTSTSFRYLGISHILSVSGLHLSILVGGLYYLLVSVRIGPKVRFVIITAFIVFFTFLTGLKAPVLRSAIMTFLMLWSKMIPYEYDPPTSLSFAAFVIALLFPSIIDNAGFILSVSGTAGILALGVPACKRLREISKGKGIIIRILIPLLMSLSISASATLFTLPAVYLFFSEFASVGLLANLIFVPICTLLLYLAVFFLIFYHTPLSPIISSVVASITKPVISFSYDMSSILPEPMRMDRVHATIILITFVVFILCLLFKRTKSLTLIISWCIIVTSLSGYALLRMNNTKNDVNVVCTSSISGNDYILINSNSKTLLCDFSNGSYNLSDVAASLSGPLLYDTSFDALLITHIHRKHITMIARLSDNYRIDEIYIPYPKTDEESAYISSIIRSAESKGIRVVCFSTDTDSSFIFEDCEITLYREAVIKRSTQPINMMKIRADKTLLYVGGAVYESDLREEFERQLLTCNNVWFGAHGPVIKEALPPLPSHISYISSSKEVNSRYGIDCKVIDGYEKIKIK